jgi:mRNA interferase RelE/StbE
MYKLEVSSKVTKFISKRTPKEQLTIIKVFETLQQNPFNNTLDIKPFKSTQSNEYRLRIKGYRFIYRVVESEVIIYVFKSGNRGDVYK